MEAVGKAKRPAKADKKRSGRRKLPLCGAMVVCTQVVIGDDKVPTLVRCIDTIGMKARPIPNAGEVSEIAQLTLFVSLKRAESSGKFLLVLSAVDPAGKRTKMGTIAFEAKGEPEA